ncbi:MAG TPA: LysM peptidoglycan-binding domain-containing protein, partial [Clostridia bacterium]
DVEKVALAEGTGSLKLALRPIKDDNTEDTKGTTWQELSVNSYSSNTTAKVPENSAGKTSSVNNNSKGYTEYTIKPGDTLEKISSDFYGDSDKYTIIKEANNIQNIDLIVTGTVIKIPVLK